MIARVPNSIIPKSFIHSEFGTHEQSNFVVVFSLSVLSRQSIVSPSQFRVSFHSVLYLSLNGTIYP